ncbi:MAG TPA: DUF4157 domain-containing protein, partial [Kofleriaceae bacterium]
DMFARVQDETEIQATLIHELVLHVIPALPTLQQGAAWEGDEDAEHGDAAGWEKVLATAASVNPTVLCNAIIDCLKHLQHVGDELVALCHRINELAGDDVRLDWRTTPTMVYAVTVETEDVVVHLVRKHGALAEVDDLDEDPVANGHDYIPLASDDAGMEEVDDEHHQLKREGAARASGAVEPGDGGLPATLRGGLEQLSGLDLEGVRVHRGSSEPARLNARAFARGTEIHLGPGNDADLAHEAWHVVQQLQGRVASTTRHGGAAINDDPGLEREADEMGARAVHGATGEPAQELATPGAATATAQLRGVTMPLVQQAIGGGFRQTALGSPQQTSDNLAVQGIPALICHYSISEADPASIHISYYPGADIAYQQKVLHHCYSWDAASETFKTGGMIRGKVWKPYIQQLGALQLHSDALMETLRGRLVQLLNAAQQPQAQAIAQPIAQDVEMSDEDFERETDLIGAQIDLRLASQPPKKQDHFKF